MNTIILGTSYLDQQRAFAARIHQENKKDEILTYAKVGGVLVGTCVAVIVAIKLQNR